MSQEHVWEREYRKPKLLTKQNKPQNDTVRFVEFLKKKAKVKAEGLRVLDLGSGAGRNSFYFAKLGNQVSGLEISKTAIDVARSFARDANLRIDYKRQTIGDIFPYENNTFDIVLDVVSSNSLTEIEREIYLSEVNRVLKPGGYFFVKALSKTGDLNTKYLLKQFPGKEKDTYKMPDLGVVERVWSEKDFIEYYSKFFKILKIGRKTNYPRMNDRSYKRNYWISYMKKESIDIK